MNIKDRLKIYFYDRAPNSLLEEHILLAFSEVQPSLLLEQLSELADEGFLLAEVMPPNQRCPALQRKTYRITGESLGDYPISTEIEAAGIKVPRLIDGDRARAEDVNSLIHAVNRIIDANTKQLEHRMEEQNQKILGSPYYYFRLVRVVVFHHHRGREASLVCGGAVLVPNVTFVPKPPEYRTLDGCSIALCMAPSQNSWQVT
jgi:hypothetical protein